MPGHLLFHIGDPFLCGRNPNREGSKALPSSFFRHGQSPNGRKNRVRKIMLAANMIVGGRSREERIGALHLSVGVLAVRGHSWRRPLAVRDINDRRRRWRRRWWSLGRTPWGLREQRSRLVSWLCRGRWLPLRRDGRSQALGIEYSSLATAATGSLGT